MADQGVTPPPPRLAALSGEETAVVAAGLGFVVAASLVAGQDAVRDTAARMMAELQGAAVPAPVDPSDEDVERAARAIVGARYDPDEWWPEWRVEARAAIIADRSRPR